MTDVLSTTLAKGNGHHGAARQPAAGGTSRASIASGDMLDVRRFEAITRMSSIFEVHLVAVSDNPDIDFEAVIGRPMRFSAHAAHGERAWTGICNHLRQIAVEERNLSTYELTLVPALWLTTQRRNHRMFQHMSDIDVVVAILGEWGISPALKLGGSYKKREYRVQYGETDYAFLSRMLEDAGVSFYFDADSTLVLDDAPQHNAARAPIPFRDNPTETDREHVTHVHVGRTLRPGAVTMCDHDPRRPAAYKLMAGASAGGVEARLERFDYAPGSFVVESDQGEAAPHGDDRGKYRADEAEASALAGRRLEAQRAVSREIAFRTNTIDPAPGTVVAFLDHPKSELGPDRKLLVVESVVSGEVPGVWTHACRAVSAEAPHRPPVETPKPRVQGVESATVVGPPGEEIHVDELGRVRLHFHWDRESRMNERSSCWIHVSQPWSGAGFGGTNLPRIGQEVIVDFLGGDPDRPIIVGRVYTGLQRTPYKLPDNKTQSGWKSNSTGGGGGYNEIMFEDLAGKELVRMQAERDLASLVKHDETATIGHDRKRAVGHDDGLSVGHDREHVIGNDENARVGRDRVTSIGRDEEIVIGHDATASVQNNLRETVGMHRTRAVGVDERVEVGGAQSVVVGAAQSVAVGAFQSVAVGAFQSIMVGADQRFMVGGGQHVTVAHDQKVKIGGEQDVMVAKEAKETVMLAKALSVGAAYQISVGGMMNTSVLGLSSEQIGLTKTIKVGTKIEIVCGKSKLTMEKSGKITLEGTDLVFKSSGPALVEGDTVELQGKCGATLASSEGDVVITGGPYVKINT